MEPKPGKRGRKTGSKFPGQGGRSRKPDEVAGRDLAQEQVAIRLLLTEHNISLRKRAPARNLSASTLGSYLADENAGNYRRLTNIAHADIIWQLLRETSSAIAALIPATTNS